MADTEGHVLPLIQRREWTLLGLVVLGQLLVALLVTHELGLLWFGVRGVAASQYGLYRYVQQREQVYRTELIVALREMLIDRVTNEVQLLLLLATDRPTVSPHLSHQAAVKAARSIAAVLDTLSVTTLRQWQDHYRTSQTVR